MSSSTKIYLNVTDRLTKSRFGPYVVLLSAALLIYGLIYMHAADFSRLSLNVFNPHTLQAARWLEGYLDLGYNYTWLELAMFEGRYYVSFPPFPSVVLLPFVFFGGVDTPDHTIALVVSLLSLVYAYQIGERVLGNRPQAMFLSFFLIFGTNYLHISLWGAVWYLAQNLAFLLTLMALYYALTDKRWHSFLSLFALCAAMGCRPFNVIYLPLVLYLIYIREDRSRLPFVKRILVFAIPALVLGAFFMWLNWARFGNVFEFGHNYLPEFTYDPQGQFYIGRVSYNLRRMFFDLNIADFPLFGSFAFWVASPLFVSFAVCLSIYIRKRTPDGERPDHERYLIFAIPVLVFLHILAFSFHRTLGGHQFGARYTIDALASVYLGMLLIFKHMPPGKWLYLNTAPLLFGFQLNFSGTVEFLAFYFP